MKTMIQGYSFDISEPYAEGQTITGVEAKALNQLRAENIGNNQRKAVQAVVEGQPMVAVTDEEGKPKKDDKGNVLQQPAPLTEKQLKALQADVTKYDGEYTLAMARGGRSRDPVESMARTIARARIEKEVKGQGFGSLKAWREKVGDDAYNAKLEEVATNPKVVEHAKRTVELDI